MQVETIDDVCDDDPVVTADPAAQLAFEHVGSELAAEREPGEGLPPGKAFGLPSASNRAASNSQSVSVNSLRRRASKRAGGTRRVAGGTATLCPSHPPLRSSNGGLFLPRCDFPLGPPGARGFFGKNWDCAPKELPFVWASSLPSTGGPRLKSL